MEELCTVRCLYHDRRDHVIGLSDLPGYINNARCRSIQAPRILETNSTVMLQVMILAASTPCGNSTDGSSTERGDL